MCIMFSFVTIQLKEHYHSKCSQYVRLCSFEDLGCSAKVIFYLCDIIILGY